MKRPALISADPLNGPAPVNITLRPERLTHPVRRSDIRAFRQAIEYECQFWCGATTALVPAGEDLGLSDDYRRAITMGTIDSFRGFEYPTGNTPEKLSLETSQISTDDPEYRRVFPALLAPFEEQDQRPELILPKLEPDDPYFDIYLAMLGTVPTTLHPPTARVQHVRDGITIRNFFNVREQRVKGSLEDVVERARANFTARKYSTYGIPYGARGSTALRSKPIFPDPNFIRGDAGPNVVVVCSPGNVDDHALLWNLRAKFGDLQAVPFGVILDDFGPDLVAKAVQGDWLDPNGMSSTTLYVTSCSVGQEVLRDRVRTVAQRYKVEVVSPGQVLDLRTYYGWQYSAIMYFEKGDATLPDMRGLLGELLKRYDLRRHVWFRADLRVTNYPVPNPEAVRLGKSQSWISDGTFSTPVQTYGQSPGRATLPSLDFIHKRILKEYGMPARASRPGKDVSVLMHNTDSIHDWYHVCDDRLLSFLESSAATRGFNWMKKRSRGREATTAEETETSPIVARDVDSLKQFRASTLQRDLRSQPASEAWLAWAERAELVVRGLDLECDRCGSQHWTPVRSFAVPSVCPGCSHEIRYPFRSQTSTVFSYRISERLRRVYESDSIGHILVLRFFEFVFNEGFLGGYPGLEFVDENDRVTGEVDVLAATTAGYIPVEVKRSERGFDDDQVKRLEDIGRRVRAPFTVLAVMKYHRDIDPSFFELEQREDAPHRILLTYDHLLDPHPFWALGGDPFAFRNISEEQLGNRRSGFTDALRRYGARRRTADSDEHFDFDW